MPWQFGKNYRRPFQSLFWAMELHYEESKGLYQAIHAQDPSRPDKFDQQLWMKEKAASRACFISGMAGIEAFANTVLKDFGVRGKGDLPEQILSKSQKKNPIDRWRLADKVYFLPTLCNKHLTPPPCYFTKDSQSFKLFEELIDIRNSIMHGRPEAALWLFKLKAGKMHEVKDDFDTNFWSLSRICKDFSSFNYDYARVAYDNIVWVRGCLVGFLEKVDDKYMSEHKIKLISPIIPDETADEKELIDNWQSYVKDDQ